MSKYRFNFNNFIYSYENISREEFFRRINITIESLERFNGTVKNVKLAIYCINKMKLSFRDGKKVDLTKELLHTTVNVLEKVYVSESLTEEEKYYHHYMAQICRNIIDVFNHK